MLTEEKIDAIVEVTLSGVRYLVSDGTYDEMRKALFVTLASHPAARSLMTELAHADAPAPNGSEEIATMEQRDLIAFGAILKEVG